MIAAGALHESIASLCARQPSAAARQRHFSIQQYNQAIQYLTNRSPASLPTENILTCCIIFIIFENLCGRNNEAAKHLKSGLAMLESWSCRTVSEVMVKEEYLIPIFTRGYNHVAAVDVPAAFDTVVSARKHLQVLLDAIFSSVNQAMVSDNFDDVDLKVTEARTSLQQWFARYDILPEPKDDESRRAKVLLRLQAETAFILLAAVRLEDECGFDEHTDSFRMIVDLCERLVALESRLLGRDPTSSEVFTYGFDLNVLPPLNIAAFKCRDPQIRRKAIALLNVGNRYEGLWNCKTVAQIAQKTLETEEAGVSEITHCSDVPSENRLRLLTLSYNPGRPRPESKYDITQRP